MIYFKKIIFVFACLLCALPAHAQQGSFAFLRVSHHCPMPYMLPDYFQQGEWGDSVVRTVAQWLKPKLKVQKVDFKLRESLTYHPNRIDLDAHGANFSETAYTYFAEVQTELTLGYNKKNLPELDKGLLRVQLQVYDQRQRKVWQENVKLPFQIQPNSEGKADVWLTKIQFKSLYNKALRVLMQQEKASKEALSFAQMPSEETQDFLQKAYKTRLTSESRGKYAWELRDSTVAFWIDLQTPRYEEKTFRREGIFWWAGKQQTTLKGLLTERNPAELFTQFANPQLNLAGLQNTEVLDLAETETQRNAWTWLAYTHNGLVKIYEGEDLKAVLVKNDGFDAYLAPHCRARDIQMIGKLLMAEVLVRALQKQYEVR